MLVLIGATEDGTKELLAPKRPILALTACAGQTPGLSVAQAGHW